MNIGLNSTVFVCTSMYWHVLYVLTGGISLHFFGLLCVLTVFVCMYWYVLLLFVHIRLFLPALCKLNCGTNSMHIDMFACIELHSCVFWCSCMYCMYQYVLLV